jgi:DNA-directed RNA polymerase subunit RPC12/RpoP
MFVQAHPQDVVVDRCTLCGRGEEAGATDWIACDSCNSWVHFSCDKRPNLGTFDDYANAEQPRSYKCPNCARAEARAAGRGAAAAARAAAAAAGGDEAAMEAAAAAAEAEEQQQQEAAAMES